MQEKPLHSAEIGLTSERVFDAGAEFLNHFEVTVDPHQNPKQFLEALKQFDPRYEGDRDLVRYELEQDQREWPEDIKDVIMRTAERMEMVAFDQEGQPTNLENSLIGHYDAVIVLGGARQANLDRARYAIECEKKEQASFRHLIIAGSDRELKPAEVEATANYAPGAVTEFDLCAGAARVVGQENPGLIVSLQRVEGTKGIGTPEVIEATIAKLREAGDLTSENASIAAITTQIYRASTELDLARVANRHGIEQTFAAGNPSDPELVAKRTPATYLSEIVRTLKAAAMAVQEEVA
ncbi:MAG: hypothetical protein ACREGG_02350 [Candidatus Saccharimonadales bacterium]